MPSIVLVTRKIQQIVVVVAVITVAVSRETLKLSSLLTKHLLIICDTAHPPFKEAVNVVGGIRQVKSELLCNVITLIIEVCRDCSMNIDVAI